MLAGATDQALSFQVVHGDRRGAVAPEQGPPEVALGQHGRWRTTSSTRRVA
jgi:hypothetical protein